MTKTLANLKTSIYAWAGLPAAGDTNRLPDQVLTDIIWENTQELFLSYDWLFSEMSASIVTVAGTASYTAPEGLDRALRVYAKDGGGNAWSLTQRFYREFRGLYITDSGVDALEGEPVDWTYFDEKVYFGPVPNSVVTVYFEGYYFNEGINDDTQFRDMLSHAYRLLKFKCLSDVCDFLDDPASQRWDAKAAAAKRSLIIATAAAREWAMNKQSQEP